MTKFKKDDSVMFGKKQAVVTRVGRDNIIRIEYESGTRVSVHASNLKLAPRMHDWMS